MGKILPVFQESSFEFTDGKVPEHIEAYPDLPSYAGLLTVFGATDGTKPYPLAVDVRSEKLARRLAAARVRHEEATIELYGYTNDVLINFPDGRTERVYIGKAQD